MRFRDGVSWVAVAVVLIAAAAWAAYTRGFQDGLQSRAATVSALEAELLHLRHWWAVEHPGESPVPPATDKLGR